MECTSLRGDVSRWEEQDIEVLFAKPDSGGSGTESCLTLPGCRLPAQWREAGALAGPGAEGAACAVSRRHGNTTCPSFGALGVGECQLPEPLAGRDFFPVLLKRQ